MEKETPTPQFYYCVVSQKNSATDKVFVLAEAIEIDSKNNLIFKNGGTFTYAVNCMEWRHVYAASCFTGDPVKEIEHWDMKSSPKEEEVFISKRKKRKRIRDKDLEDLSE